MVLEVMRLGEPVLMKEALPVRDFGSPSLRKLVADMWDTLHVELLLEGTADDWENGWEGCLSVPGMRGVVPRARRIHYTGFGLDGETIEREAQGFHARVVQHEFDHLKGIVYPMRIKDWTHFGYSDVLFPELKDQR